MTLRTALFGQVISPLCLLTFVACSGGEGSGDDGGSSAGGVPGTGGEVASGGSSTGGSVASGGAPGSGGAVASGGVSASGGASGSGAAPSTGGEVGSGGDASGGATSGGGGTEATGGTGGDNSGGTSSGGSGGNPPAIGPGPCGCTTPAGEFGTVNSTIVVDEGEVYDGGCKIFRANPDTLGDGSQGENQLPVFRVNDGGTLKNVILGASAADGVHLYGDVTLQNVHWQDIGEDAMTVKESGTVNLDCGSAQNGDDKVFQVNAASTIHISNFTAKNAGKFMRQNGDTTFKVEVFVDHSDISSMDECIFRTDSSTSHVTFTNSRYSDIGDSLFIFGDDEVNGNSGQSSVTNIEEY